MVLPPRTIRSASSVRRAEGATVSRLVKEALAG